MEVMFWIAWAFMALGILAIIGIAFWLRRDIRHCPTEIPVAGGGGAGGGGAPPTVTSPATPPTGVTQPQTTASQSQHEPVPPASAKVRWGVLAVTELLLFTALFVTVDYILSKVTTDGFYTWVISLIGWVILSVFTFRAFFRTVGVYQLAHTQSLIGGQLRRYGAGTKLLLPWETLTEEKIVDTEMKVIELPPTRVAAGDGSPFDVTGQIRYHVHPDRSHRFIGVHRPDLEKSLIGIALQIIREETARYATAEEVLKHLPETIDASGNTTALGIIGVVECRFMNGPKVTRIEDDHGIEVDGVPISLTPAKETETHFLKRFEDLRLAESAAALRGLEEQARLALLNNPDANFSHVVNEEKQSGDRTVTNNINVSGTSGDSLKGLAAAGTIIAQAFAAAKGQPRGGGSGGPQKQQRQPKQQTQQKTGGTP